MASQTVTIDKQINGVFDLISKPMIGAEPPEIEIRRMERRGRIRRCNRVFGQVIGLVSYVSCFQSSEVAGQF